MIFPSLLSPFFLLVSLATLVHGQAQVVYDNIHNATNIIGSWSSGSQAVLTGPGSVNPANMSFNCPPTTGISYSFTEDNYFESFRFRMTGNGTNPNCITIVLVWIHGNYSLNPNGSITLYPFPDGYQQVQDRCAAVSSFVQPYSDTEFYQSWRIFLDPTSNKYHLHMFEFDGSPLAPQTLVSVTPNMLPTQQLRNSSQAGNGSSGGLTKQNALATGGTRIRWSGGTTVGAALGTFVVGLAGLAL